MTVRHRLRHASRPIGKSIAILLANLLVSSHVQAEEFGEACKESPKLVGECFTIRGRLIIANGGWQLRIWPVGTKRLLAVVDSNGIWDDTATRKDGAPYLTPEVHAAHDFGKKMVFADYTLCPITPDVPGEMRHVCMAGAKNIVASPFE